MAARMIEVQREIDSLLHTRSTPPPPAGSPDALYGLLLALGRSRVDRWTRPPSGSDLYGERGTGCARQDVNRPVVKRPVVNPPVVNPPVNRPVTVYGEIFDLWIRALRSGRYHQGRGFWHYRDEVCAVEVILHELGYQDSGPREPLAAKVGLELCGVVIALNDLKGWSFRQIADWLETDPRAASLRSGT